MDIGSFRIALLTASALTTASASGAAYAQEAAQPQDVEDRAAAQDAAPDSGPEPAPEPAPGSEPDPETEEDDPETARDGEEDTIALPRPTGADRDIVVTGSRLGTYDRSNDVRVYTAQDIEKLGVSNVQDFVRLLPQNQPTVGYGLNNRERTEFDFDDGGLGGLGVGGINLRGMGTKNTLVLVDGRRVAGAAGIEAGFVNINNIPLSAIERVEISLSGGSSVYGADALGGVVNFILKKGYTGYSASARTELSSTGADTAKFSGTASHAWGTGSVLATASYTVIKPALNAKLGYVTNDYRGYVEQSLLERLGRANYPLDQRGPYDGAQPGAIVLQYQDGSDFVTRFLQARPGIDYSNPSFADLQAVDPDTIASRIPRDTGERQENVGVSLNLSQDITRRLRVSFDYIGSINESHLREIQEKIDINNVPFDQAYNPVAPGDLPDGAIDPVFSAIYFPQAEYRAGTLPRGSQKSRTTGHTFTGGAVYDFDPDTAIRANYTHSIAKAKGTQRGLLNITYRDVFGGGRCGLDTFVVENFEIADAEAIAAAQCAAITSSDPALAFNFLNDGSQTVGAPANVFFVEQFQLDNTTTSDYGDILLTAAPFALPAGKARFALGGEYRTSDVSGERIERQTLRPATTDVLGIYGEARLPLIDADMGIPAIRSLDLSASARYDRYSSVGPVGTVGNVPVEDGGEIVEDKVVFDRVSPRIGLAWTPVDGLLLRGSWSSNFTPPPFTSLYDIQSGFSYPDFLIFDPFAPDGNPLVFREIIATIKANPDLRPETSQNYSAGLVWTPAGALSGLSIEANYYYTRIKDQIGISSDLAQLVPPEAYFGSDQFFRRDAAGNVVEEFIVPINIGRQTTETFDISAEYSLFTKVGAFTGSAYFIRNLRQETEPVAGGPSRDRIGYATGQNEYEVVSYLEYRGDRLSVRLTGRYTPSYRNDYDLVFENGEQIDYDSDGEIDQPFPVDDLLTFDLNAVWRPGSTWSIIAGARNLFDADPPFALIDRRPFDASRYDIRGRVAYLEARMEF